MTKRENGPLNGHGGVLPQFLCSTAIALVLGFAPQPGLAQGTQGPPLAQVQQRNFDIPAQPLTSALTAFGDQAGMQVTVDTAILAGRTSQPVSGSMAPEEALRRLLAGSGITWRFADPTTLVLSRVAGSDDGAIMLDPVTVEAQGGPPRQAEIGNLPPAYTGGQVATGSKLGLLGIKDVMDTPFNQTSYTAKKIQDQQARTIKDSLIDNPSVQDLTSPSGVSGDNINIRGFRVTSPSVAYGGLYGILPTWSTMSELAERVEVLNGPSSMLNGLQPNGSIGGALNVVPKRAPDETLVQVTPSYASTSQLGGHIDIGHRFGPDKQLGVRFNGVYRDSETAVEDVTDESGLAVLGLDYRGERVRLSADLGYQDQDLRGIVPIVQIGNGIPVPTSPDASINYGQPWNFRKSSDVFGVVRGEVDVSESITAYAAFGAHDFRRDFVGSRPATVTNLDGDATVAPQRAKEYREIYTGEVGVRARVDTGPIGHELALGASFYEEEIGLGVNVGTPYTTNIYNPTRLPSQNIASPDANKSLTLDRSSLAFADTLSAFDERIQLTVGARLQKVGSESFDTTTGAQTSSYDESALTPSVALVVKPLENVSLYGNIIQGLQEGEVVGPSFANAGEAFPPFKATQYEAGVKVDWGKVTTTASVFQITQPSVVTDLATNTRVRDGEQRNRGLELNAFGELIDGVRILGGAMFIDPVLTKTQGGLADGWDAPNTPDLQLKLAGEWDLPFAPGLTLTGRALYTSSQYIDTSSPRRSWPEWTRFDVGARYTFEGVETPTGKPIVIRFNIENVLDEDYWLGFGYRGAPRTFMLSTSFDF